MRRSSGSVSWMRSSPPVTPASAMNEPISMWSGPRSCVQPPSSCATADREHVRADAAHVRPHLDEHPREVLDVGLARGVADDRRPRRERGRHERVLGGHDRRLVHEHVAGAQAPRASRTMSRSARTPAPSARKASRCGSRRRRPMTSPPGDGISARPKRASSGPASRNEARMRSACSRSMLASAVDAGGADGDLVLVAPLGADAEPAQDPEHRLDVADARHVAHDDLLGGQDRGGEDRESTVLVAGRADRAGQRHAAVDDELLHEGLGAPLRERRTGARLA